MNSQKSCSHAAKNESLKLSFPAFFFEVCNKQWLSLFVKAFMCGAVSKIM